MTGREGTSQVSALATWRLLSYKRISAAAVFLLIRSASVAKVDSGEWKCVYVCGFLFGGGVGVWLGIRTKSLQRTKYESVSLYEGRGKKRREKQRRLVCVGGHLRRTL